MGRSSRPYGTCLPRATGLMPPGSSQTTRSAGCSTGKRERSTRSCRRFLRSASADHPDLALAHAASQLNHGRLEEAVCSAGAGRVPRSRALRRLAAAASRWRSRLCDWRWHGVAGQFSEVIEQVNLLDASITDESSEPLAMGSELRAVALLNLGIVETWSGRLTDAERHLFEGAAARPSDRPTLPGGRVSRASGFPVKARSRSRPRASAAVRR